MSRTKKSFIIAIRANSHGVPSPKSQVPLILTCPNMEAKCQLLNLKKQLQYDLYSLELDLDYFMQKNSHDLC